MRVDLYQRQHDNQKNNRVFCWSPVVIFTSFKIGKWEMRDGLRRANFIRTPEGYAGKEILNI